MTEEQNPSGQEQPSTRPNATFSGSGGLHVAVWKQKNDAGIEHYSVKLDRRYKDSEGNFQSTESLREGDLLRAQRLLGIADDWIEQDRLKQRATQAAARG
jgi:hypothetical protein